MKTTIKKWATVFGGAFLLNLLWEFLHSALYVHYKNGPITEATLIHAAFFDAFLIMVSIWALSQFPRTEKHASWILILWWILFAALLESWALAINRWAYNATMPIIPILNVGITPTAQLALTGWVVYTLKKHLT